VDAATLKTLPLFSSLADRDLREIARYTDEVDVEAGRKLIDQGRFAYEFFLIEDGTAEVTRDGEHVANLGKGDFFGELALLATERRTASVTATTAMRLVVMHRQAFLQVEQSLPSVAAQLRDAVSARMPPSSR
jgi:CRP/FNR family transcriptional regulator, cyclic AMP receptor protein